MELAERSRRSIRNQCKLSDYVTPAVAESLSCKAIPMANQQSTVETKETRTEQPETPTSRNNQKLQAKTPMSNTLRAHIQRDLDSPSANIRLRALKAMKSPTKSAYAQFDVSHSEKSIITADEREQAAKSPPSLEEVFRDIVVYVEVRTGDDDRSAGVKKVISTLGARVNDNLRRDTTHVIFKDGRQSTFKKAKSLGIPIVSLLWIEACKNQRRICDIKDYQISNLDRYENPELYGKMKRYKFIQPGSEDKRRRLKKQPIEPTPPKSNQSQTDIAHFFKTINKTAAKTVTPVRLNNGVESPATVFLNQITSKRKTPISSANKTKSIIKNGAEKTPVSTNRRSSIETNIDNTTDSIAQMSISQSESTNKNNKRRRRTMLPIANSTRFSDLNETCNNEQRSSQPNETVVKEELIVNDNNKSKAFTVSSTVRRKTYVNSESMDITETPEQKSAQQQRTLFTPQSMVECSKAAASATPPRVATPAPEYTNDETIIEAVPILTTPTLNSNFTHTAAAPLSAARHLCRRRTLFDLSMDIISHQVQNINAKSRQSLLPMSATDPVPQNIETCEHNNNAKTSDTTTAQKVQEVQMVDAACGTTVEKKKRKLFKPLDCSNFVTPPITPSKSSRESSSANSITPKVATKRRRTLVPAKSSEVNTQVVDTSPSLQAAPAANKNGRIKPSTAKSSTTFKENCVNSADASKNMTDNEVIMETSPDPQAAPTTSKNPSEASLLPHRSTLDFEPQPTECSKALTTKSSTTLKENDLKSAKASQNMTDNEVIVESTPNLQTALATSRNPSKALLLSRRSTLDFEPQPTKPTLRENNVNATNANQNMTISKQIAQPKRRLPFLAFTNMRSEQVALIHEAVKKFGGFIVERTVGPNTTHMVSLEPRRTMNILRGLVRGLWILDFNWILDSLKAGCWLNEEHYEMKDFSRAVEICRAERQAFGQNYKCELFADLGAFFISSRCENIPARDLKELIHLCGGNVVDQRKNAKYILSSSTRAVDDKIYVTPLWILDSITKMQLLRIKKYSAITQLPTKYTPSNTRNMPTAVDLKE